MPNSGFTLFSAILQNGRFINYLVAKTVYDSGHASSGVFRFISLLKQRIPEITPSKGG